ncbi:MAG: stage 0 sporulation family protein [Armatimonadetes bacterium]|nr:stage 0 sporulation family protein [Armatimonadota bacterium]
MPLVVGVSFRKTGKIYHFDPQELSLSEGDFVIAETARGIEFGEVMLGPREVKEEDLVAPLKKVVRIATGDDLDRAAANRDYEKRALETCQHKIAEHGLPMKLLDAEYCFDGSQVTFSFSAEGRVDFRELVKDLAATLRTKVQLHQIGVRDEAKLIGGYGSCGRQLCCSSFLSSFEPVSMKMAKDQSLFLNPAKFSGVCGKLLCCLRYEHEFYKEVKEYLPAVGAVVQTSHGRGKIVDINVVSGMLTVELEEALTINIPAQDLNLGGCCRKHGVGCQMKESHCQPLRAVSD